MHIGDCRVVTFIFNNKSVNSSIILRESNTPGLHPFREMEANINVIRSRYTFAIAEKPEENLRVANYNPLKLPNKIKVSSNTGTLDYIYDANGNKLAVKQGGTMKNVYCGDFVYNTSLAVDYILTPNGQLTRNPSTGAYTAQYNITDHLGNVRSVVNSGSTVLQSTDYYPFGLAFSDANITNNRYLYNGKELEDYTIGTSYLGTLDYGARHYDPRIARWTVPDPMAEKYYGYSSYTYCLDNPINLIDIKGNEPIRMFIGTAAQFKELLDTSPNRVGGYTGQKAANYLRGLGSTDIKNGRPSPTETGFFNNKVGRYIYT